MNKQAMNVTKTAVEVDREKFQLTKEEEKNKKKGYPIHTSMRNEVYIGVSDLQEET